MGKIWMAGGNGVDLDVVTAGAGDILMGKVIVDREGDPVNGTMADKSGTAQTATATLDAANSRLQMAVPATGKYSTASKLYAAYSTIRSLIGLTAAKIATGNTILGLAGSYKGLGNAAAADVRKGKTFSTASLSNTAGTMTEKAAATYTPGKSNQVIAANQFLAGAQTILGDADLIPANIIAGKNIFNVAGTARNYKTLQKTVTPNSYMISIANIGFTPAYVAAFCVEDFDYSFVSHGLDSNNAWSSSVRATGSLESFRSRTASLLEFKVKRTNADWIVFVIGY